MSELSIAILGTGNIGTDLLLKVQRSQSLSCRLFAGRNLASPGMTKAAKLGVPVSAEGIHGIERVAGEVDLVFDATSAAGHLLHAPVLKSLGMIAVDLTPAKVGKMCVPAVNLNECLESVNVNMVTCGGQASIPLAYAIGQAHQEVEYIETVSSIASRSAGPGTRINLDEYLETTESGLRSFSGCQKSKAILNLNPAQPCIHMQTTVMAKVQEPDLTRIRAEFRKVVSLITPYVPGYEVIVEPLLENGRVISMVRVSGLGDYLPKFAGNLDIINCAAIAYAEALAKKRMGA